jgi:uncharacterized protein YdbL (DUF1318 family)
MRRVLPFKLLLAVMLVACVTVNVYFPAAAVEQAADQFINNVTGRSNTTPQGDKPQDASEPPRTYHRADQPPVLLAALGHALELLVPAAHAQSSPNIDAATPETRAIQASMRTRFPQLEKYFDSGALGLTNDGLIAERDTSSVPLAERATVKRLVAEDNRDRATLYTELAKANAHPEWEADIRKVFAQRWVETGAKAGWYYQDSSGAWKQK